MVSLIINVMNVDDNMTKTCRLAAISADDPNLTIAYRKARKEALRKFLHEEVDRERYQKTVETFIGNVQGCTATLSE